MMMDKRIEKIACEYGYTEQSRQCMEEMAELTVALNKLYRHTIPTGKETGRVDEDYCQAVLTELADVRIMIDQIQFLLKFNDEELENEIDRKLKRQLKRIKKRRKEKGEQNGQG